MFTHFVHFLQANDQKGVSVEFVTLAGNHSVWAAQQELEGTSERFKEEELRYRKTIVFKNSDLSPDLRLILAGPFLLFLSYPDHKSLSGLHVCLSVCFTPTPP